MENEERESAGEVIKRGICFYDNSVEYEVRIIRGQVLYGTGDYEDLPNVSDDREIECYEIWYENLIKKGEFNRVGQYCLLQDAILCVEEYAAVQWKD
jgi:hypothetical protein